MEKKQIPIAQPSFNGNEKKYVLDALDSGWVSSIGPYIESFERQFAAYHGVKHAIATHNGTIALHLALAAVGIRKDEEVIVPDLTFIATANSVRYCNAIPVLTDVAPDSWNLCPDAVRRAITPKTRAIIPVHLYGNPAAMHELLNIAAEHNLLVIEDCAEALGASYSGQKTGTFGHINCFSFFGNKIITTGEGGMCITNDDKLAERMRVLRDHGMNRSKKYWYDEVGFNYRMTNLQAALGVAQFEQLDQLLTIRDQISQHYHRALEGHPAILFQEGNGNRTVNWMFTIRLKGYTFDVRNRVIDSLKMAGIDSRPVFYPISMMPFYQDKAYCATKPSNALTIAQEGLSLPTYAGLDQRDIDYVCKTLINILNNPEL